MEPKSSSELFVKSLLCVLPNWHTSLVRPFKERLSSGMSLETYCCLETLKAYGTATMTELAHQLKVPKQQVTELANRLAEHQFIERIGREDDRRAVLIRLTPRAVAYLDEYYLKNTAFAWALGEQLTENELEELNEAVMMLERTLPKLN